MSNEQILKATIEKAKKNGFDVIIITPFDELLALQHYKAIIFDHSFAKAFWGEKSMCSDGTSYEDWLKMCLEGGMTKTEAKEDWEFDEENFTIPTWQFYLQQMVLEEEPLKYLEKFLNKQEATVAA